MSLQKVFDAVKPLLVKAASADGVVGLPYVALGEEALPNPETLPAIVWVPRGGPIVPPRQAGADGVSNPRNLWMRQETVHVYVYTGGGFQETETLVGVLVATMQAALRTWSFRPTQLAWSHGWPLVESDEPQNRLSSGTLCIVTCQISIPLVAEPDLLATITSETITGTMNPPGGT